MRPSQSATLIGYFPKRVLLRPASLKVVHVVDICSASECMWPGPEGWIDHWRHNAMWCYDSPEIAASIPPAEVAGGFELFAYRMLPWRFDDDAETDVVFPALNVQPLGPSFEFLGYDAVECAAGVSFSCSPLSCNGAAESEIVNPHCLVDDEVEIIRLARTFAKTANGFEPGPYVAVEVWRQRNIL